jgi:hypothetical protein
MVSLKCLGQYPCSRHALKRLWRLGRRMSRVWCRILLVMPAYKLCLVGPQPHYGAIPRPLWLSLFCLKSSGIRKGVIGSRW